MIIFTTQSRCTLDTLRNFNYDADLFKKLSLYAIFVRRLTALPPALQPIPRGAFLPSTAIYGLIQVPYAAS